MRLEKKNEEELAKRKGLTGKTIIQGTWFILSFAVAYFLITFLINQEIISYQLFYGAGIPRIVPQWVILLVLMLIIVGVMQFIMTLGFMWANPEGRRRLGEPSLHSRNKDPFDNYH